MCHHCANEYKTAEEAEEMALAHIKRGWLVQWNEDRKGEYTGPGWDNAPNEVTVEIWEKPESKCVGFGKFGYFHPNNDMMNPGDNNPGRNFKKWLPKGSKFIKTVTGKIKNGR